MRNLRLDQTKLPHDILKQTIQELGPLGSALFRGQFTPSKYTCKDDFAAFKMADTTATCTNAFPVPPIVCVIVKSSTRVAALAAIVTVVELMSTLTLE